MPDIAAALLVQSVKLTFSLPGLFSLKQLAVKLLHAKLEGRSALLVSFCSLHLRRGERAHLLLDCGCPRVILIRK